MIFQIQLLSLQNPVCIHDDVALLSLTKDFLQRNGAECSRFHQISQNTSRTDTWKLMNISHHDQPGSRSDRAKQRMKQKQIDHGHFINDHCIRFQRIVRIPLKSPEFFLRPSVFLFVLLSHCLIAQEPVNRCRLVAGGLRHSLGRTPRRRRQEHRFHICKEKTDDGIDGRCFSGSGTSAD